MIDDEKRTQLAALIESLDDLAESLRYQHTALDEIAQAYPAFSDAMDACHEAGIPDAALTACVALEDALGALFVQAEKCAHQFPEALAEAQAIQQGLPETEAPAATQG